MELELYRGFSKGGGATPMTTALLCTVLRWYAQVKGWKILRFIKSHKWCSHAGVSQSHVTEAINRLEELLGIHLSRGYFTAQ